MQDLNIQSQDIQLGSAHIVKSKDFHFFDRIVYMKENMQFNHAYKYYLKKSPLINKYNRNFFQEDFNILSVQRSLKIIGIFSRLFSFELCLYCTKFFSNVHLIQLFRN